MTTEERLARLETIVPEIRDDVAEIKRDVKALSADVLTQKARSGGFLLACGCIGAAVTWALTNVKAVLGILPS